MTPYLLLAGLLEFIAFCWWVRKAGADSIKAKTGEQNEKTAAKVADAVAAAPDNVTALREHVRDGGKL